MDVVNAMKPCWLLDPESEERMRKRLLLAHMEGRWTSFSSSTTQKDNRSLHIRIFPVIGISPGFEWRGMCIADTPATPSDPINREMWRRKKHFMHEIISASRLCLVFFLCSFCLNSFFFGVDDGNSLFGKIIFSTQKRNTIKGWCWRRRRRRRRREAKNKSVEDRCYHSTQLIGSLVRY